jgi:hypothetical protein
MLFLAIATITRGDSLLIKQINYFINPLIREEGIRKHLTSFAIIAIIIKLFIVKLSNKTYNFISLFQVIKLSNCKHLIPRLQIYAIIKRAIALALFTKPLLNIIRVT